MTTASTQTICLALPTLYDAVVQRFADDSTEVPNVFGWRETGKQSGGPCRIVWIPGDDETGDMGELIEAKRPGRNARSIGTLVELFTVRIEAQNPAAGEDERTQYQATRELYDAWWRAVYLHARGTITVFSNAWVITKKERRFGATIRVVCGVEAMIPDEEYPTVAGAGADVGVLLAEQFLDVGDDIVIPPTP